MSMFLPKPEISTETHDFQPNSKSQTWIGEQGKKTVRQKLVQSENFWRRYRLAELGGGQGSGEA